MTGKREDTDRMITGGTIGFVEDVLTNLRRLFPGGSKLTLSIALPDGGTIVATAESEASEVDRFLAQFEVPDEDDIDVSHGTEDAPLAVPWQKESTDKDLGLGQGLIMDLRGDDE